MSISIPGFPNLFVLNGPNGPVGSFSLIARARAGQCREISPTEAATTRFDEECPETAT